MTVVIRIAVLLAFLALAACGGSDDTLSREEFEQEATDAQAEVQSQIESLRESESADDLEERADEAAEEIRERADELEDLEAPDDARETRDDLVQSFRELADSLEEQAADVSEEDFERFLDQLRAAGLDAP